MQDPHLRRHKNPSESLVALAYVNMCLSYGEVVASQKTQAENGRVSSPIRPHCRPSAGLRASFAHDESLCYGGLQRDLQMKGPDRDEALPGFHERLERAGQSTCLRWRSAEPIAAEETEAPAAGLACDLLRRASCPTRLSLANLILLQPSDAGLSGDAGAQDPSHVPEDTYVGLVQVLRLIMDEGTALQSHSVSEMRLQIESSYTSARKAILVCKPYSDPMYQQTHSEGIRQ